MTIKEAMSSYFERLNEVYQSVMGTKPSVSYDDFMPKDLLISEPDEDEEVQWIPVEAKPIKKNDVPNLCQELADFYSTYYYWQLRGKYKGLDVDFSPVFSYTEAIKVANGVLEEGKYYFPNDDTALLASCCKNGNDDLLLFYRQKNGTLFLYDQDTEKIKNLDYSLIELISSMKASL